MTFTNSKMSLFQVHCVRSILENASMDVSLDITGRIVVGTVRLHV